MCELDGGYDAYADAVGGGSTLSRRSLLATGVAALAAIPALKWWPFTPGGRRILSTRSSSSGLLAVPMAMHLHTSFSEGRGSMAAHISEAIANGIQTLWFTDHDWRMSAYSYRKAVHFNSLLNEREDGNTGWHWQPVHPGTLAASAGGLVTSPASPLDPSGPSALHVMARSSGRARAAYGYSANSEVARRNGFYNVVGLRLDLEVFPLTVGPDAWLELVLPMSYRPSTSGRPAGIYDVTYRFGLAPASHTSSGIHGFVSVPIVPNQWNSISVTPQQDIATIWPDLVSGDNGIGRVCLQASSQNGAASEGFFDYLRFTSNTSGDIPLSVSSALIGAYAQRYPQMDLHQGVEVSWHGRHVNQFGGTQHLYQYSSPSLKGIKDPDMPVRATHDAHVNGGIASLNHPFGAQKAAQLSAAQQASLRRSVGQELLTTGAYGSDILEVGYRLRYGCNLETHMDLFDTLARNGLWLTATGVSDDHEGTAGTWGRIQNRFVTSPWSESVSEGDLLASLKAGRAFVGELRSFGGSLDIDVDGNPMGSVSFRPGTDSRVLTVRATGLPSGSHVEVVQGPVDYAGAAVPDPGTTVIAMPAASDFDGGLFQLDLDTRGSTFVRVNVVTQDGTRVAFSNPIWALRDEPPSAVPDARRAADWGQPPTTTTTTTTTTTITQPTTTSTEPTTTTSTDPTTTTSTDPTTTTSTDPTTTTSTDPTTTSTDPTTTTSADPTTTSTDPTS